MAIERPNQVWAADITYIPIGRGFLYLVAVIDWASRAVLSRRLSNTMEASFCVSALEEALARFGTPEIFNTDQGSQFTSAAFTGTLMAAGVKVSMDGRGRWMDNVFIERLWPFAQIRGHLPQALRRRPRGQGRDRGVDRRIVFYNLQSPAPSSGAGRPHADGGLARRRWRRDRSGCGYDASRAEKPGQRTTPARCPHSRGCSNRKQEWLNGFGKKERLSFQLTNRNQWSSARGPLHSTTQ